MFKSVSLFLLYLCSFLWAQSDSGATALIDTIISRQKSFITVQCKFNQSHYDQTNGSQEYSGFLFYRVPAKICLHFLEPADEYVVVSDSLITLYGVENEYGMRFNTRCMSSVQKQISDQVGHVRMNTLEIMRPLYNFIYLENDSGNRAVISALPKTGWKKLTKILITIDLTRKVAQSIELYAQNTTPMSKTYYSSFIKHPEKEIYFPQQVEVVTSNGDIIVQKDLIQYSRVLFDKVISDKNFTIPVSPKAKIVDNFKDCK